MALVTEVSVSAPPLLWTTKKPAAMSPPAGAGMNAPPTFTAGLPEDAEADESPEPQAVRASPAASAVAPRASGVRLTAAPP